jgi:hypothetical protein
MEENMRSDAILCFGEDIEPVITQMKNALGDILYSLEVSLDNPRDVYKKLKIDKKLGWKIYNVACEEDPFLAAQFVPGVAACNNLIKSFRKLGTPEHFLVKYISLFESAGIQLDSIFGDVFSAFALKKFTLLRELPEDKTPVEEFESEIRSPNNISVMVRGNNPSWTISRLILDSVYQPSPSKKPIYPVLAFLVRVSLSKDTKVPAQVFINDRSFGLQQYEGYWYFDRAMASLSRPIDSRINAKNLFFRPSQIVPKVCGCHTMMTSGDLTQ